MKKLLKNSLVGIVPLSIWAIISINSWPLAPVFFFAILMTNTTGSVILSNIIAFYLPTIIAVLLLCILAERTIQDIKSFMYGILFQIAVCTVIALIDPRDWTFKILYASGTLLIQIIGAFLHWCREKRMDRLKKKQMEEGFLLRKRRRISTGTLWILLALDIIGWTVFCGVCLIVRAII